VAFSMAAALVDKFGGDSIEEMRARWKLYQQLVASR
jgi:chorismate synthase